MNVGRGLRELPETYHANFVARQAKRHAKEREAAEAALKAERENNARLENELHRSNVETIVIKRAALARRSEADTKKLIIKVEQARQAWCVAGRQGVFPVYDACKAAEHELFGGLAPVPPNASPTDPKAGEMARRAQQESGDAYKRLGLENPAHGSRNPGNTLGW
jgi:hypothetical protein